MARHILHAVVAAAICVLGGCAERQSDAPLSCSISADKKVYRLGEVPKISVRIRNHSADEIVLVGSLDASAYKRRYPYCSFRIIGPDGKSAIPRGGPMCGNMNSLRTENLVLVPPGGEFNPYRYIHSDGSVTFFSSHQIGLATFRKPGEYKLIFEYSTECEDIRKWQGFPGQGDNKGKGEEMLKLFRQVPKRTIESNELTVVISSDGQQASGGAADELYSGFQQDRADLRDTHLIPKQNIRASSGKAGAAANRVFSRIDFVGMSRADVLDILGDPETISDYGRKSGPDRDSSLVYRFDSGWGGNQWTILFRDGVVDKVRYNGIN